MARRAWRPVELPPVEGSGTRGGSGLPYSPGVGGGAASQRAGGGGGRVNHLLARRAAAAEPSSERSSLASEGNHRRSGLSTRPVTSPVRGLSERERAHPLTRRLRRVGADTKGRAQKKVSTPRSGDGARGWHAHRPAEPLPSPGLASLSNLELPAELSTSGLLRGELARDDIDEWLASHAREEATFSSLMLYCELRMRTAEGATKALASPNVVRATTAAQLLAALAARSGAAHASVMRRLARELLAALFLDPDEVEPYPFFVAYADAQEELSRVRLRLGQVDAAERRWRRNAENRMRSYRRACGYLFNSAAHEKLHIWRTITRQARNSRRRMAQAVAKWRKADLMRAFSHWRDALLQGRVGALKKGVSELRKALLAAEARERDLEGDLDAERRAHGSTKTRLAAADATIEEQRAEIERLLRLLKASERSLKLGKAYAAEALRLRRGLASMAAEATDELKQRVADLKEGTFQDVTVMLNAGERSESLLVMDPNQVMLRWANYHLKDRSMDAVKNFGPDIKDAKVVDLALADEVDPLEIAKRCVAWAREHTAFPEDALYPDEVLSSTADLVYVLLEHIFTFNPGLDLDRISERPAEGIGAADEACERLLAAALLSGGDTDLEEGAAAIEEEASRSSGRAGIADFGAAEPLLSSLRAARAAVKAEEDRMWGLHNAYVDIKRHTGNLSKECLALRARGQVKEMADEGADEERAAYTQLAAERMADLLPDDQNEAAAVLGSVCTVLGQYYKDLKRIFVFYSAGGFMSSAEFWKLVKDSKIPTKKFASAKIDLIFLKANKEYDEGPDAGGVDDEDNPDTELMPAEYVEVIVRMAAGRAAKGTALPEAVRELVERQILPNACKSDAEQFRGMLKAKEFVAVMDKHRKSIRKIFMKYSGADLSDKDGLTMNRKECTQLFKDALQIGGGFDFADIKRIFGNVQDLEGNAGDDAGDDEELVFTEFLELLVCVCIYRDPNPFMPLDKRFDRYVTQELIKPLKAAKKVKFS